MNKKGNTLVEVIVSFTIVAILTSMMITIFVNSKKINHNLVIKENIIAEIENVNAIFTNSPVDFLTNLDKNYVVKINNDKYIIYFNNKFLKTSSESSNYFELSYVINNNLYELNINTYLNTKLEERFSNLSRKIYV